MSTMLVIGGTGMAGSEITQEAKNRGFDVTVNVRNADRAKELFGDIPILEKDVFDLDTQDLRQFDIVVDAFANHQNPSDNFDVLTHLVHLLRNQKTRAYFVLGAGSLKLPNGKTLHSELKKDPANDSWIAEPKYGVDELYVLENAADDVVWTGVSPQDEFVPGQATEHQIAQDEIINAADGKSHVTAGNLAIGLLDEIETPKFTKKRFTVSDV